MRLWQRTTYRYLCYGAIFGAMFPITATGLDLWLHGRGPSLGAILAVQAAQPLHWMIDTAPLFLGLFAAFGGWRQEQVERANRALSDQNRALDQANRRAEQAEELAHLNAENAALYARSRQQIDELERLRGDLARAAQTISALALPLIPVDADALVLPLIGAFDGRRVAEASTLLLARVAALRTRTVIIDCTGVEDFDSGAAHGLTSIIAALDLLGAASLLTGVSPALAQDLVGAGLSLGAVRTAPDVASALRRVRR